MYSHNAVVAAPLPTNYAASDTDRVRVGGMPSSLEAASSQTWASCRKDTLTSLAFASRAHWKHSSAIARYSAAVFMRMQVLLAARQSAQIGRRTDKPSAIYPRSVSPRQKNHLTFQ